MFRPIEGLPTVLQQRIARRKQSLTKVSTFDTQRPIFEAVLRKMGRWLPGQTVRCAFSGGSKALRAQVESAARTWEKHGNIHLSFRDGRGRYLNWHQGDTQFHADIRIGFDQEGYWSLVGTDSTDGSITKPGEATMNFSGFVQNLPGDWSATVIHEFGHALGFEHEHQSPTHGCDAQFRWNDDPGYVPTTDEWGQYVKDHGGKRPGIYTVLGGPPNSWSKATIDFNLRQLKDSRAYDISAFDAKSIMKYYFEEWMFTEGTQCSCYSTQNHELSDGDKQGVAAAYPSARTALFVAEEIAVAKRIIESEHPPEEMREQLSRHLE